MVYRASTGTRSGEKRIGQRRIRLSLTLDEAELLLPLLHSDASCMDDERDTTDRHHLRTICRKLAFQLYGGPTTAESKSKLSVRDKEKAVRSGEGKWGQR